MKHKVMFVGGFGMLYLTKEGDTLFSVARKFNTTEKAILGTNAICNPECLPGGHVLSIPSPGHIPLWCGSFPYYISQPGDTVDLISARLNADPGLIKKANGIKSSQILPYDELLIERWIPGVNELENTWRLVGDKYDNRLSPDDIHNIFYKGSFLWEANRADALMPLRYLLNHKCDIVRLYSAISMARLARRGRGRITTALKKACNDKNPYIGTIAAYALERIHLASGGFKRVHILPVDNMLFKNPANKTPSLKLDKGTRVVVLQWNIPGVATFDRIQIVDSGETGYLPRFAYNEVSII